MKNLLFLILFLTFIFNLKSFTDEIILERKVGKKYQKMSIKNVIIVEETQNCVRYLIFNNEFKSPEPRLANKTEGGEEQCAVIKKASEEENRKILQNWKKQGSNAIITFNEKEKETVNCIAIKYPLSAALKDQPALRWHKPALLLRDGSEIKFTTLSSIQLNPKTAIAEITYNNGKTQSVQFVLRRRIQNGDLPGVVTGITDKFSYFRLTLDKISKIDFLK